MPEPSPKRVPAIGDVVLFHFELGGRLRTRPAIVTEVWPAEHHPAYVRDEVNLRIILDGPNDLNGSTWQGSVPRAEELTDGCWSWRPSSGASS